MELSFLGRIHRLRRGIRLRCSADADRPSAILQTGGPSRDQQGVDVEHGQSHRRHVRRQRLSGLPVRHRHVLAVPHELHGDFHGQGVELFRIPHR